MAEKIVNPYRRRYPDEEPADCMGAVKGFLIGFGIEIVAIGLIVWFCKFKHWL